MAARDTKKNTTDDNGEGAPPKRQVSMLQIWFEEAWEGWLKSVGSILLLAAAFALYKFDLVGEGLSGAALVLAVIGGSLGSTALPAWPLVRTSTQKGLFVAVLAVAALATGYPAMRAAVPARALGTAKLTTAQSTVTVHTGSDGPYELAVGGSFKQATGEAEVTYTIRALGANSTSDEVSGSLSRSQVRVRTSRRGGTTTTTQERTENAHRLAKVRGGDITFSSEGIDEQLADGLLLDVRPGGLNPILFIILGALALLGALGLDARLTDQKGKIKSYLAVGVGICFVFALRFPEIATPHSLVRPAIDALLVGAAAGGLGGWMLGALGRVFFGPKIVKKARK